MPVTRITDFFDKSHARERRIGQLTGPTSYATGGEDLTPESIALMRIDILLFDHASNGTDLRIAQYDYTNKKVKWFDLAGAEISAATNLSTYSCRFEAVGK